MPILKFHLYQGRSPNEIDQLLDAVHDVVVQTFDVPAADRYQIVNEHSPLHMRALDTGLGFSRTDKFVLLEVVSRPRGKAAKVAFYENVCTALQQKCSIAASDVMVSFTENSDEDWSFGHGRAQFLTGEL
ncbi:tautomerase family protein [Mesorhizobium sp. VK24D]|uniref:Tautomerase family protein n=1 Tax=Mesorhizobium album TaxID=3072314 RepID=A0ABU4Y1S7_9HYPH|nr:tautomerase family protein [Mesorhizobium sp. VK24D]MDX8479857.1 tautomerase family protein [Mesorhizobium sp. VK24D]